MTSSDPKPTETDDTEGSGVFHPDPAAIGADREDTEGNMPYYRGISPEGESDDTKGSSWGHGISPEGETDDTEGSGYYHGEPAAAAEAESDDTEGNGFRWGG